MQGSGKVTSGNNGVKNKVLGLVCAAAVMVTAGSLHAQDAEVPPGQDFVGVAITIDTRSQIIVYAGLREVACKVGVCGVIWFENATGTARQLERRATQKIRFSVAGQRLRVSTQDFNRFDTEEQALAGLAGCSASTTAWQAGFASQRLDMAMTSGTLRD
jgi:hypothetical protein